MVVVSGTGTEGWKDGAKAEALMNLPTSLCLERTLLFGDCGTNSVRRINLADGSVSAYAGSGAPGMKNGSCEAAAFSGVHRYVLIQRIRAVISSAIGFQFATAMGKPYH